MTQAAVAENDPWASAAPAPAGGAGGGGGWNAPGAASDEPPF